jgi:hypothetical protein
VLSVTLLNAFCSIVTDKECDSRVSHHQDLGSDLQTVGERAGRRYGPNWSVAVDDNDNLSLSLSLSPKPQGKPGQTGAMVQFPSILRMSTQK